MVEILIPVERFECRNSFAGAVGMPGWAFGI
jgi:hypothetical protein